MKTLICKLRHGLSVGWEALTYEDGPVTRTITRDYRCGTCKRRLSLGEYLRRRARMECW